MAAAIRDLELLYRERFAGFVGALGAAVGDRHLAEECVQAAFVGAVANAASFRGGSLAAWVWRIAVNRAVDAGRRDGRFTRPDIPPWEALAGMAARDLPPAGDPAVRAALMALSPRRRLVVFLRYFADLGQGEIADLLGTSEGTVAATLSQTRRLLKEALQPTEVGGVR